MKHIAVILMIAALLAFGCSGGGDEGTGPTLPTQRQVTTQQTHSLLGLWQFTADPVAQTLDYVPLRMGEFHLNPLPFLEPPPFVNLGISNLQWVGNIIDVDVSLTHPFLGLTEFTGYDVAGIFISNGSISGFDDPNILLAGEGDTRLLNPDAYSRWWNPDEFPHAAGIFGYNDGLLGRSWEQGKYNCTLNGYKYFADEIGVNDDVSDVDPTGRGVFSPGSKNTRHYTIELGSEGLVFNYAVDASWNFPLGTPPWIVPDSWPQDANRAEAWNVSVAVIANSLYSNGGGSGGLLGIQVDVYDWFGAGLHTVKVESPGNFAPTSISTPTYGGEGFSAYFVEITDTYPLAAGEIDLLISIISEEADFQGFIPGTNTTAYYTNDCQSIPTVDVLPEPPDPDLPPGDYIFVDDSNTTGIEDGSMAFPYDTIQEGLAAAANGDGDMVVVDDSGNDYNGPVYCEDDVYLISFNWNNLDGSDRAQISYNGNVVVYGADYAVIDGFSVEGGIVNGIKCSSTINTTIRNCQVSNIISTTGASVQGVKVEDCSGIVIEDCGLNDIGATISGFEFYGIWVENSTITITRNVIHGIHVNGSNINKLAAIRVTGSDPDASGNVVISQNDIYDVYTEGAGGGTNNNVYGINIEGSAGVDVFNNTVHEITSGSYGTSNGIQFENCDNAELINNVVYDIEKTNEYGFAQGVFIESCLNFDARNNIVSNIHVAGFFQLSIGVRNAGSTYSWEYNDVYDVLDYLYMGIGPGTGCINVDPDYVAAGSDFHLDTGSPCIDSGDPNPSYNDEEDDSRNDMGAYGGPDGDW